MAIEVVIRDIEDEDINNLYKHMRQADREEVSATTSMELLGVINHSVELSTYAQAGLVNDELVCLWGVCPISMLSSKGAPWMLSTDVIEKYPLTFLKRCKPVIKKLKQDYNHLENHVDVRNTVAIHWLKWLGFKFDEPKPWGVKGLDFQRFSMEKE